MAIREAVRLTLQSAAIGRQDHEAPQGFDERHQVGEVLIRRRDGPHRHCVLGEPADAGVGRRGLGGEDRGMDEEDGKDRKDPRSLSHRRVSVARRP